MLGQQEVILIAKRRPNGDGMIRKRADGRWEGRIIAGHKEDGKPIYKTVFAKTQKELIPKLNQLKETYAGVELTEDSRMTLGEWLEKWLTEYKAPMIRTNPADGCKLPPKKGWEMEILTPEEMQRLLIQAKEEGFYEMFLLALSTGMRRGELLALQWDDINFTTGEVKISRQVQSVKGKLHISQPKTKSSVRSIILPPALLEVLREYRQSVNSRWLFPSPVKEDVPRDPTSCRKRLSKILEHAGCKHVRFHDLRHTFATHAIQYGMDVKTLAATIGHASVETTLNIYSHVTDEMQKNAAQKLDQTIGAVTGVQASCEEDVSGEEQRTSKEQFAPFEPYKGVRRKPGKGCISQISETTWEGRYSPRVNGKKVTRNVYAHSLAKCEEKLAEMIREMKEEITAQKSGRSRQRKGRFSKSRIVSSFHLWSNMWSSQTHVKTKSLVNIKFTRLFELALPTRLVGVVIENLIAC